MAKNAVKAQPPTQQVFQLPSAVPATFVNALFAGVDSNKESVFLVFSQTNTNARISGGGGRSGNTGETHDGTCGVRRTGGEVDSSAVFRSDAGH